MNTPAIIETGKTYVVDCPFVRAVFDWFDEDGKTTSLTWKPGVVWEFCGPDDSEAVAHGVGKVVYHVIDIHQLPRPYPARVFFTRKWIDPPGKEFGTSKLRIMTREAFSRRLKDYRYAGFEDGYTVRDVDEAERAKMLARQSA